MRCVNGEERLVAAAGVRVCPSCRLAKPVVECIELRSARHAQRRVQVGEHTRTLQTIPGGSGRVGLGGGCGRAGGLGASLGLAGGLSCETSSSSAVDSAASAPRSGVALAGGDCQANATVEDSSPPTIIKLGTSRRIRDIDYSLPVQPQIRVADETFASQPLSAIAVVQVAGDEGRDCVE